MGILRDLTAQTGPLTKGQLIVAQYETDPIAEPCELAQMIDDAIDRGRQEGFAEAREMREALLRIAFPQESGVDNMAGNPNKWSSTIAYKAIGGRFHDGQRLDTKQALQPPRDEGKREDGDG